MSKEVDGIKYYIIGEAAKKVDRLPRTIKNWYEWAEKEDMLDQLPEYRTDIYANGARFFTQQAIDDLIEFRDNIVPGEMASHNRTNWGTRGEQIAKRMGEPIKEKRKSSKID